MFDVKASFAPWWLCVAIIAGTALALGKGPAAAQTQEVLSLGHGRARQTVFDQLSSAGLSLAQSYDLFTSFANPYDNDGVPNFEPASFSLSRTPTAGVGYTAQFFLGWRPGRGARAVELLGGEWTPMLSAEGNLNSDDDQATDAVRFRLTGHGVYAGQIQRGNIQGLRIDASLKYEASRTFDTEKFLGDFQFRPTYTALGIGRRTPAAKLGPDGHIDQSQLRPVQLMWQPWIGMEFGRTLDQPKSASEDEEKEDTLLRVITAVEGRLYLNALSKPIGLKDVYLVVAEKFYYLPLEDSKTHNFFRTGIYFILTVNASISLTYDIGRDAPNFEKVELLRAGFGLRF